MHCHYSRSPPRLWRFPLLLSRNRHNGDQLLIVFFEDDTATQA
jgi:hypothetical protein